MTWIIEDWAGNHCYKEKTFTSFEDARDFISEQASKEADASGYDPDTAEHDEIYDGVCEDLYAVEVKA